MATDCNPCVIIGGPELYVVLHFAAYMMWQTIGRETCSIIQLGRHSLAVDLVAELVWGDAT